MKFTALPVNQGDSFLLKSDDKYLLVDGGGNQKHILTLLNNEKIKNKHIHYLACTHYDSDHFKGILGILNPNKNNKYSFCEIWLPSNFGFLYKYTKSKLPCILKDWINNQSCVDKIVKDILENYFNKNDLKKYSTDEKNDNTKLKKDICKNINSIIEYSEIKNFNYNESLIQGIKNDIRKSESNLTLLKTLDNICTVVKYARNSGSTFRWLKFKETEQTTKLPNNIIAENAIELQDKSLGKYNLNIFIEYLLLSKINQQSLVFKYEKEGSPNILFTADSDLAFYNKAKVLNEHSIVTAPHHASKENDSAYNNINGKDLIFVKGYNNKVKNLSSKFLCKKTKKYCTCCNTNPTIKQKVVIDFITGTPPCVTGKPCACK